MTMTYALARKTGSSLRRPTPPLVAAKSHPATAAQVREVLHGPHLQPKLTAGPPATVAVQCKRREYHGVGGWIHKHVYEPAEAFWTRQLQSVETLAWAWNEKVPVLGYVGGMVAGSPTLLVAHLARSLIYALELFTPLTEEEHFLVGATMGAGGAAIPVMRIGRWIIGALAPLFAKRPRLAWKILPRIKEVVRAVFQKLAERLEKKAAAGAKTDSWIQPRANWIWTPEKKAAAGAKPAPVDPFAKTVEKKARVDPYARTEPGQPAIVESVTRGTGLLPDPHWEKQINTVATTLKGDEAVRAAWGEAARHYPYWHLVEAYFRVANLPEAERATVLRLWLRSSRGAPPAPACW